MQEELSISAIEARKKLCSFNADLQAMREVLEIESDAILSMASNLDESHLGALSIIRNTSGTVIMTGVGKSGHIAKKAAATFASTGTRSQFIHPTEASHGDLGMMGANDVCIAISNSGETKELSDIITYVKRFNIPLVAITGNANSTLALEAQVALILPKSPEACSIGVAPTTSTTATLAICDALAVALMRSKGFRKEDFYTFHPGGKLGSQLIRVEKIMHVGAALPLVLEKLPMQECIIEITEKGFGVAAVLDENGRIMGVISDGDLRRNMLEIFRRNAGEICNRVPKTISSKMLASEALGIMNKSKISSLFVVNDKNEVVGLLHLHDCVRAGIV